jgi:hypothetical protein
MIRTAIQWLKAFKRKAVGHHGESLATAFDREAWQETAQEGDFEFHKSNLWRQTDDFMTETSRLFQHFGLGSQEYSGSTVIDLGAGSRLRSKYFSGAEIIAIEPLAERYTTEIEWCDLSDAAEVYSRPAEEKLHECVGRADLLISINVLDHCYNFDVILGNIRDYLKPGGLAFLSFDKHLDADSLHPLQLTEEFCEQIFRSKGLRIQNFTRGFGDALDDRQTYGHGPYCLNYWLVREGETSDPAS